MDDETLKKSHYISNDYFSPRRSDNPQNESAPTIGSLGGEISYELGFGNLESAIDYAHRLKAADDIDDWQSNDEKSESEDE